MFITIPFADITLYGPVERLGDEQSQSGYQIGIYLTNDSTLHSILKDSPIICISADCKLIITVHSPRYVSAAFYTDF